MAGGIGQKQVNMTADQLIERLELTVTPEQHAAILELESCGLMFCCHFGISNAQSILVDMNEAFDMGCLYEWMTHRLGIV
jgi:hypothetical protein